MRPDSPTVRPVVTTRLDVPRASLADASEGSDCLVVATDHSAFEELEPEPLASRVRTPRIVDPRATAGRERGEGAGFEAVVLGDGSAGLRT